MIPLHSESVGVEQLLDVAPPLPGIFGKQAVCGRTPFSRGLGESRKVPALVVAVAIENRAALQAPLGDSDSLARDVADGGSAERSLSPRLGT